MKKQVQVVMLATVKNDIKEFVNNNYSFFTEDTRNKMILGINNYLKQPVKKMYSREEVIEIIKKFDTDTDVGRFNGSTTRNNWIKDNL